MFNVTFGLSSHSFTTEPEKETDNSLCVCTRLCATEFMTPDPAYIQGMRSKKIFTSTYSGKGQRVYKSHIKYICPKA